MGSGLLSANISWIKLFSRATFDLSPIFDWSYQNQVAGYPVEAMPGMWRCKPRTGALFAERSSTFSCHRSQTSLDYMVPVVWNLLELKIGESVGSSHPEPQMIFVNPQNLYIVFYCIIICIILIMIAYLLHAYWRYNVEVTLAMWVSIQDLKKTLNTEFSIGPKSVTIMIPGCQYKNSVPKLRQFFKLQIITKTNTIFIYIITICYILKYSSICYNRTTCYWNTDWVRIAAYYYYLLLLPTTLYYRRSHWIWKDHFQTSKFQNCKYENLIMLLLLFV